MFSRQTLLLAAMASATTAQLMPRATLAARQASDEECAADLSSIVQDMPTINTNLIQHVATATDGDACTQVMPLSLSSPLLEVVTAFGHWAAEKSQDAQEWIARCDDDVDGAGSNIINPIDAIGADECMSRRYIVFTEGSTTTTLDVESVVEQLGQDMLASMTSAQAESGTAPASTEATETGSAASTASSASTASDASESGSSTAAESAAESSGEAGDDDSGAARFGMASAAVAAVAGVAGLLVAM